MRDSNDSKPKSNGTSRDAISPDVGKPTPSTTGATTMTTKTKKAIPTTISAIRNKDGELVINGKKQTPKVSHAKTLEPPKVIAEIYLIPIDRIEVSDQVRTIFSEESIIDLANDIQERGLRSPVEVTPIGDERYELTLGERRLRAVKYLGQKVIPAIIVKTDKSKRLVDQLAENIQREDLELTDQVKAIRKLHDELKSVAAVSDAVKKSAGWVSKRLAMSHENFGYQARYLMERNITEDVELLNVVSQIENEAQRQDKYEVSREVVSAIEAGKMDREQARAKLKELKAAGAQKKKDLAKHNEKQKAKAEKTAAKEEEKRKLREEGTGPEFIDYALNSIAPHGHWELNEVDAFVQALKSEQRQALEDYLNTWAEKGRNCAWSELQIYFRPWSPTARPIEQLAILAGLKYQGQRLELIAFCALIHQESTEAK